MSGLFVCLHGEKFPNNDFIYTRTAENLFIQMIHWAYSNPHFLCPVLSGFFAVFKHLWKDLSLLPLITHLMSSAHLPPLKINLILCIWMFVLSRTTCSSLVWLSLNSAGDRQRLGCKSTLFIVHKPHFLKLVATFKPFLFKIVHLLCFWKKRGCHGWIEQLRISMSLLIDFFCHFKS